jgi:hypothetical protein
MYVIHVGGQIGMFVVMIQYVHSVFFSIGELVGIVDNLLEF